MLQNSDGRRVYVHKDAFGEVAQSGWAYETSRMLAQVRLAKLSHHFIADGIALGTLRPETAQLLTSLNMEPRRIGATAFLKQLTYKPILPWREESRLPILLLDESIYDTCYQDDFYTFATGQGAANRMFADRVPMRELKLNVATGAGPEDLTIITRRSRLAVNPADDTPARAPVSIDSARIADRNTLNDYRWGVAAAVDTMNYDFGLTHDERDVTSQLATIVTRRLAALSY